MIEQPVDGDLGKVKVANRFTLQKLLGLGASGAVYQAFDEARGATIALKFLTDLDPGALFRFKAEFRALANLAHPNLLQLYELLTGDDEWLLSMELVQGGDFLRFVRPLIPVDEDEAHDLTTAISQGTIQRSVVRPLARRKRKRLSVSISSACPFDEARLRGALAQLSEGLQALHRADRLHRDLKPANVLVAAEDGRVVICDFGLALTGTRGPGAAADTTESRFDVPKEVAGTLPFMSPEQSQAQTLTAASDWYSVGVMLYQALTGRTPFSRLLGHRALIDAKLNVRPAHPRQVDDRVPNDLAELALALLQPDPQARAGYSQVIAALEGSARKALPRRRVSHACIGRDSQLNALDQAFAHSRTGSPAIAFVSGVSGMGKSSLARDFLARIEQDPGALVLRGRCYEREELPYKALDPLMDALSSHLVKLDEARLATLLPPSLQFLAALFPALKRVPAIAALRNDSGQVADLHERRRLAFRGFRELCRRLTHERPLVLFIDDLQWGDLDSAALFQELLAPPGAPPLLIMCAYRSDDAERSPLIAVLRGLHQLDPGALRLFDVSVGALSHSEATRLALDLLRGVQGAEQVAALIAHEAEGNPFFIHELTDYVDEHGVAAASRIRLDALIRSKLGGLAAESCELLSALAVAGKPMSVATLGLAAKLGASTFKSLRDLEQRRLVATTRAGSDERVECYHDRIREAACNALSASELQKIHRALAEALEQANDDDCDALLEHWRGAGERSKACLHAQRGARRAEAALAFSRAAELYRQALALLPDDAPGARELRERHGHALILAGRGPEAAAVFQGLIAGAAPAQALTFRSLATAQLLRCGKLVEGFAELERAADLFGAHFPRSEAKALAMLLARRLRIRLKDRAIRWNAADRDQADSGRLEALWEVAAAVSNADMLRGSVYGAELMLRALELGDPSHIASACGLEAIVAAAAHRPKRAQRMFDLSEAAGQASGHLHLIGRVRGMQAICRQLEGRWQESVRLARESQELQLRCARVNWDYAIMIWWEITSLSMRGQLRELATRIPEALRDVEARGDVYAATGFRTHRSSWAWLALDRPDTVDTQVDIAEREWKPAGYQFQHWHMTYARCEADLYRGTPRRSFERFDREWARSRLARRVQGVRIDMLYTRGRLALALARESFRPSLVERARADGRALQREGVPFGAALGSLLLAGAASFGNESEAARLLLQAESQLNDADMAAHAAAARVRRGELTAGSEGQSLVQSGLERMHALGAKRPDGFVAMLLPMAGGRVSI